MALARGNNIALKLMLLSWLTRFCILAASANRSSNYYVQDACSVTQYRDICIRTLASFSSTAKQNPITWARAGASVAIGEAKSVTQFLVKMKRHGSSYVRGRRSLVALSDCVVLFQDADDNLHRSLFALRNLSGGNFETQMGDVMTWLSAALTDEGTCLDGFAGVKGNAKRVMMKLLRGKVSKVGCITSNALALANKLATTGPASLAQPLA